MASTVPDPENTRGSESELGAASEPYLPDNVTLTRDRALLGFLSKRYYRPEAVEHFLRKSYDPVPLSIAPPWSVKALVAIFVIALVAVVCESLMHIDLRTNGTLLTVAGHPALAISSDAPVSVGATLTVSGISQDVRVASIEPPGSVRFKHVAPSGSLRERPNTQILLLGCGSLPGSPTPVSVRLNAIRLITIITAALKLK